MRALAAGAGIADVESLEVTEVGPRRGFSVVVLESLQIDGRKTTQRVLWIGWQKWCPKGDAPGEGSLRRGDFWTNGSYVMCGGVFVVDGVAHEVGLADNVTDEEAELVINSYLQSVDYVAAKLGERVADLDIRAPRYLRKFADVEYAISLPYRDGKDHFVGKGVILVQRDDVFEVRGVFEAMP